MNRRHFLSTLAASAVGAAGRPPNIVWFMYDDLGSATLGCYGQEKIQTPHSDRLAREGTKFSACYAGGSVCAPSRSVLMTGQHLGHTPVRANAQTVPFEDSDVTVAEVLKKAGYATGAFGKWGLGDAGSSGAPTRQGFDEFFGYLHQTHAHNYWPEYLRDGESKYPLPENVGRKMGRYSAPIIAERSYQFIEKNREKPFYLFATPTLPHALFHPPNDEPYSKQPWTKLQRNFASMVTAADAQLGRILALLDKHNLADNTIVFCTSDNGGIKAPDDRDGSLFRTNGSLRDYKGSFYEGGLRVPMIVRWPKHVAPGKVDATPWYFADFLPTAASIAGVKPPPNIDGVNMMPVITGGKTMKPRPLYWEQQGFDGKARKLREGTLAQAVRFGQWKAIRLKPGASLQLYNLAADPSEQRDVASANPKIVAQMEGFLTSLRVPARPHDNGNPEWTNRKDIPETE